jgi:hypothetical protein
VAGQILAVVSSSVKRNLGQSKRESNTPPPKIVPRARKLTNGLRSFGKCEGARLSRRPPSRSDVCRPELHDLGQVELYSAGAARILRPCFAELLTDGLVGIVFGAENERKDIHSQFVCPVGRAFREGESARMHMWREN